MLFLESDITQRNKFDLIVRLLFSFAHIRSLVFFFTEIYSLRAYAYFANKLELLLSVIIFVFHMHIIMWYVVKYQN